MEVMKQLQYSPVSIEDQVVTIYAATKGYMDELPLEAVKRYESEMLEFIKVTHPAIIEGLSVHKSLTDEVTSELDSALDGFTERFKATLK